VAWKRSETLKANGKIEFKTLPMMNLRNSPGDILDRVSKDNEVFVVERNGQPKACLVPVSFLLPDISAERIASEIQRLKKEDEHYKLTINEETEIEFSFHEIVGGVNEIVRIILPHGYPTTAPRILVDPLPKDTPMRWDDGSIQCFGVMEAWDLKKHNVLSTLQLGRRWLKDYKVWRSTEKWPGMENDK
jgi:prevent-host-death family protein